MYRVSSILLAMLVFGAVALPAQAAYFFGYPVYPYIGADYQHRVMPFRHDFGDNAFESNYAQGQAYLGIRFLTYMGLEATFSQSALRKNGVTVGGPSVFTGVLIPPGGVESHQLESRITSYSFNLMGFWPISFDPWCRNELYASVGVSVAHPKQIDRLTSVNNVTLSPPGLFTFDKKRAVIRFSAGYQYLVTRNLGIRASVAFEDLSQYRNVTSNEVSHSPRRIAMKNSTIFGLGIFFKTSDD